MYGKMRFAFVALVAAFIFAGQSQVANAQFTITVQVTEGTVQGPPISGVNVRLLTGPNFTTEFNAQTDGNGTCSFPGISGSYDVAPTKPGYTFNPETQGGNTGPRTLFFTGTVTGGPTVQFNAGTFSVGEGNGSVAVTVVRGGSTAGAASVNYATSDSAGLNNCNVFNGVASARCDYAVSVGTINFAAGEAFRTISIPIVNDSFAEGNENFSIALSNPVGGTLGQSNATITIVDNESSTGPNPIDQTAFFVRQHYIDFLGREPDPLGFQGWQDTINNCAPGDTSCDRIHVSSNFFRSLEFQERGYFVYRFYSTAFGRKPEYEEFIPDLARVSGFLDSAQLEAVKVAFINEFTTRSAFTSIYNPLDNTQYVDTLLATANVSHPARTFWITALGNGTRTRAQVLREIAESGEVNSKYFNQAFVVMQYFGYLRRNPDAFYLDWIAVLDANPNDFRGMVSGFMNSSEYRSRFGP